MRLFLDQMFRVDLADQQRMLGHDVVRASELGLARADDPDVLAQAVAQDRLLVTLDGHFGDWAVLPLRLHPGVVRVKVHPTTTDHVMQVLRPLLRENSPERFRNHLVIASAKRARWINTAA